MVVDVEAAEYVLRQNDRGGHTVPTDILYPFQWNWDSAITALGWMQLDEQRAWAEMRTMFDGQWDNGMLPHILFHGDSADYFPGPDVWGSGRSLPTSAISQPPVWATAIRRMAERASDRTLAHQQVAAVLTQLLAYHDWWYRERDPRGTGLVRSYHPWESGMDNSPAWDEPLARVPPVAWEYQRRDLGEVDASERPHKPEYDRYLYLVDFYKNSDFDSDVMYADCPYRVIDVGIVAILQRATRDLIELCRRADRDDDAARLQSRLDLTRDAIEQLWSDDDASFLSHDDITDEPLRHRTTAGLLPLFGGVVDEARAERMAHLVEEWLAASPFGLASTHPRDPAFEPQRYWRGPVWLHINWMIAEGLGDYGFDDLAERIRESSRACVQQSGYCEYFDALTGRGCGGGTFSWTAAVTLFWL